MSVTRILQLSLILVLLLASLAAPSPANAWGYCGGSYVVQRGDWLSKIANTCGVTLADLRAANPWTYYERYIFPGQVLVIPGGYVEPETGGPVGFCGPSWDGYSSYWVVCRGDTLGSIARYYGVSWRYLQWNNNIANANLIYAGQVIRP
jgi:N-acetylmuramoyl-L-alanine amidase